MTDQITTDQPALSKNQVVVLDFIEANGGGPFTAKDMEPDPWRSEGERNLRTGLGAPSIKSNCESLVKVGLLAQSKQGRSFAWSRTDAPRPETAEVRKERLEAERMENLRKQGLAHMCQGCLRIILINETGSFGQQDKVCRHGWEVRGSTRGYGLHGTSHSDGCRGWNHVPLEVGFQVALSVVADFGKSIDHIIPRLDNLATKPTLRSTRSEWEGWTRKEKEENLKAAWEVVEVNPGDKFEEEDYLGRMVVVSSYDTLLVSCIADFRESLRNLASMTRAFVHEIGRFHSAVPEVIEASAAALATATAAEEARIRMDPVLNPLTSANK